MKKFILACLFLVSAFSFSLEKSGIKDYDNIMESYEEHLSEADRLMEKASQLDSKDPQIFLIWGNINRKSSRHLEALNKYKIA